MNKESLRNQLAQRLNKIFCDVFDDDDLVITDTMTADDVDNWDSLTHITLVVAVEKEFGVRLSPAEVGKLEDVGAMLTLLEARVAC